jgi:hypothetical protein
MTHTNIKLSGFILSLALMVASSPAMAKDAPAPELQVPSTGNSETQSAGEMVNPSDRNFQALQRINNRYQCGVSTSQEPVSRSAFSKNVEVCLNSLEAKLAQSPGAASKEDLQQLNELATTYRQEMTALNDRVEKVETKLAQNKETNTFSPNTKLVGEVIFALSGYGGSAGANPSGTIFSDRVRLNFDTSFTGKDRLRARIQARNTTPFSGAATTGTNTTRLGFDGSEENAGFISLLQYKMPLGDKANIVLETVGSEFNENMYTFNPLLAPAGTGSISRFGRFNPIYRLSGDGAAITGDYKLSDKITASVGYAVPAGSVAATPTTPATPTAPAASPSTGIFGGNNSIMGQLRFEASPGIDLGLAYARSYNANGTGVAGSTGTAFANSPFTTTVPTTANHYSAMASAKLSPGFVLSGWAGITNAQGGADTANLFNYAVSAAFPDFGAKGNTLGFVFGSPPKVTSNTVAARVDAVSPIHLEAVYKVKLNDNLDITPGLLLITNPDTATRATEYVGTIRSTFKF